MKIYDAYADVKIRRRYKKLLIAERLTIGQADKVYTRFGTYLSRMRGVGFDVKLSACKSESEFREMLRIIFDEKWKGHMEYHEVPTHFYRYLNFLHALMTLEPHTAIEGLAMTPEPESIPLQELSEYELPYVDSEGKLGIILNPWLVKRIMETKKSSHADGLVEICRRFYGSLLPGMTDAEWQKLIDDLGVKKSPRQNSNLVRNIEITTESSTMVLNPTDALHYVVMKTGVERLRKSNLKLNGDSIIRQQVPAARKTSFRCLGYNLYLNIKGTGLDKFKLMVILNSQYSLGLELHMVNKPVSRQESDSHLRRLLGESGSEPDALNEKRRNPGPIQTSHQERCATEPETQPESHLWNADSLFGMMTDEEWSELSASQTPPHSGRET